MELAKHQIGPYATDAIEYGAAERVRRPRGYIMLDVLHTGRCGRSGRCAVQTFPGVD